jgi:hypothetical protein
LKIVIGVDHLGKEELLAHISTRFDTQVHPGAFHMLSPQIIASKEYIQRHRGLPLNHIFVEAEKKSPSDFVEVVLRSKVTEDLFY